MVYGWLMKEFEDREFAPGTLFILAMKGAQEQREQGGPLPLPVPLGIGFEPRSTSYSIRAAASGKRLTLRAEARRPILGHRFLALCSVLVDGLFGGCDQWSIESVNASLPWEVVGASLRTFTPEAIESVATRALCADVKSALRLAMTNFNHQQSAETYRAMVWAAQDAESDDSADAVEVDDSRC